MVRALDRGRQGGPVIWIIKVNRRPGINRTAAVKSKSTLQELGQYLITQEGGGELLRQAAVDEGLLPETKRAARPGSFMPEAKTDPQAGPGDTNGREEE